MIFRPSEGQVITLFFFLNLTASTLLLLSLLLTSRPSQLVYISTWIQMVHQMRLGLDDEPPLLTFGR